MSNHTITTYVDAEGKHRWNIAVTPGTPGGSEKDIVADSGEGYANRQDMLHSLFGIFFGTYDESYLTLYQEWNPNGDNGTPIGQQPPVEEQAGTVSEYPDGRVGVPAPDGIHDGGVTDDD